MPKRKANLPNAAASFGICGSRSRRSDKSSASVDLTYALRFALRCGCGVRQWCLLRSLLAADVVARQPRAQDPFSDAFWQYQRPQRLRFQLERQLRRRETFTEILFIPVTLQGDPKGRGRCAWIFPGFTVTGPALLLDAATALSTPTLGLRNSGSASRSRATSISTRHLFPRKPLRQRSGSSISPRGKLKKIADGELFTKGLGTGAWDYGGQVEVAKTMGKLHAVRADWAIGSPAVPRVSPWTTSSTGQRRPAIQLDRHAIGGERRRVLRRTPGGARRRRKRRKTPPLYVNYRLSPRWTLQVYAVAGMSRQNSHERYRRRRDDVQRCVGLRHFFNDLRIFGCAAFLFCCRAH